MPDESWSVFNEEDGLTHRLCPRDSMMGRAFQEAFKKRSHLSRVRTDCRIKVAKGTIGHATLTCIVCIACPMEPT